MSRMPRGRGPSHLRGWAILLGAMTLLAILLAVLFSSPDEAPSTIGQWSRHEPVNFLETADAELSGTSATAEYGPPYNHKSAGEHAAFFRPQKWLGVTHPIDPGEDYVIGPLRMVPDPTLRREIGEYLAAQSYLKADGVNGYKREIRTARVGPHGSVYVRPGEYENVENLMRALLNLAQSGGLDGDPLTSRQRLQTDYTAPLLFMADGGLLRRRAERQHLPTNQWIMMDETGSYPGQPWLWPYAVWYRVEPFKSSTNADCLVMLTVAALSLALICVPLLPGVRDMPRWLPLHRLIWRERHRDSGQVS
jgi:hypothetical protein